MRIGFGIVMGNYFAIWGESISKDFLEVLVDRVEMNMEPCPS